jgi:hypothetical protein
MLHRRANATPARETDPNAPRGLSRGRWCVFVVCGWKGAVARQDANGGHFPVGLSHGLGHLKWLYTAGELEIDGKSYVVKTKEPKPAKAQAS